jgi:hypothetical protein
VTVTDRRPRASEKGENKITCKVMKKQQIHLGFSSNCRLGCLYFPSGNFEKWITVQVSLARGGTELTSPSVFVADNIQSGAVTTGSS